jgi:hypothetical protein
MTNEEKLIILEKQIEHICKKLERVGNYDPESLVNFSKALINLEHLAEELALRIASEESKKRFRQYFEDSLRGVECEEVNENE